MYRSPLAPRRRHRRLRWAGWVAAGLVVLVIAAGAVQWLRPLPSATVRFILAADLRAPGRPVRLPWPGRGAAAAEIPGIGLLGTSGGNRPRPIASLAKVMTAYVILAAHPLRGSSSGPTVQMTAADVADYEVRLRQQQSVLKVAVGERLSERQLLEGLLIPSANNIAAVLARWDAGSERAFVARMNATAARLGLRSTTYTDPSGLRPTTVSTPRDQLRLAIAAMRIRAFARIVAEPAVTLPVAGTVNNFDFEVGHDGVVGVKTGSDNAAGGCWAFAARRTVAGRSAFVYGVVLDQRGPSMIQSALDAGVRLADAAPGAVRRVRLLPAGTLVGYDRAPWRAAVPVVTAAPLTVVARPGAPVRIGLLAARVGGRSLRRGERLGTLRVVGAGTGVALVAARAGGGPTIGYRLTRL